MYKKSLLTLALLGASAFSSAEVLTTVKPLGFIANAITDGVTETKVLLPATASPHDYSLKPSDVEQLRSAKLVVWIGEEMERFLEKNIEALGQEKVLTLQDVEAIKALVEQDEDDEEHKHEHQHKKADKHSKEHKHGHHDHDHHGHDHHDHDEDWHIWLSPQIAEHIADNIATRLILLYPDQQAKINENLANFKAGLAEKNRVLTEQLSVYKNKGYYTFHDAYGHFEQAYGLKSLGSFTINPTVAPGAKTLAKIKRNLADKKVSCLFAEPQFTPKVIESLSRGTSAHIGRLDPLGEKIVLGRDAYPQFLQNLADEFSECLQK